MEKFVKIVGVIVGSLIAIAATLVFLLSSLCAIGGGFSHSENRMPYVLCALVALAAAAGAIWLIRKLKDDW